MRSLHIRPLVNLELEPWPSSPLPPLLCRASVLKKHHCSVPSTPLPAVLSAWYSFPQPSGEAMASCREFSPTSWEADMVPPESRWPRGHQQSRHHSAVFIAGFLCFPNTAPLSHVSPSLVGAQEILVKSSSELMNNRIKLGPVFPFR